MSFESSSLVEILSEFVCPGKWLLWRGLFVTIEQVLLIRQVAELVGGGYLKLVVLQRCQ